MNDSFRRLRRGGLALGLVFIGAVLGYRFGGGWSWLDSVYMVVITISTIGYSEIGPMTDGLRVFTIGVVLFGLTASGYAIGGFLQLLTAGEVQRQMGLRRMTHDIKALERHVIVCGFGRIGRILAEELHRRGERFVVIDREPALIVEAQNLKYLAYNGDATEENVLVAVGIVRAKTLVTALPDDAANVFITLTARNLNPKLQIIARGELPSTQKKLVQAGADRVVLPAAIGGLRMAAMITHPTTVEFMELVAGRSSIDVEIDELVVPAGSPLIGKTVLETEARRRHGLLVVAVKRTAGGMIFNPDAQFIFQEVDTVIVMGRIEDIARFRIECGGQR